MEKKETDWRGMYEAGVAFHFKQWGAFNAGVRMGKKKAGRILDNRTWDQFPQATA